jgi:putative restriction endonuclease
MDGSLPTATQVRERFRNLHQHQQDGNKSLHKPLLALYAVARVINGEPSEMPFSVAEAALAPLTVEYATSSSTSAAQSVAYPFTRLRFDGIWQLDSDVPMDLVGPLREGDVTGHLEPGIEARLKADPELARQVARDLAVDYFDGGAVRDVLHRVGLEPDDVLAPHPLGGRAAFEPPVDEGYKDTLSPDHLERLAWFEEHAGQVTPWPEPLPVERPLATKAKGIYKPGGWDYALSVKILPESRYDDGHPVSTSGGGWLLSYHQEGNNPDFYTNAALKRCIQDRVPVGVIRKVDTRRRQVEYEVLGLARPVRWYGGYFILESVNPSATTQVDALTDVLAADSEAELNQDVDDIPPDDYDARRRVQAQITQRRGQPEFRAALIRAYGGRCAVTRCDAVEALEAAHIQPYRGPASNVVSNGLPLRSDIHTLYDLDLIAINPDTYEVVLAPRLHGTHYASLAGVRLLDPRQDLQRPNRRVLLSRWDDFHAALRSTATRSGPVNRQNENYPPW